MSTTEGKHYLKGKTHYDPRLVRRKSKFWLYPDKNSDISNAVGEGKYGSHEDIDHAT